jgi:hypothetical protein
VPDDRPPRSARRARWSIAALLLAFAFGDGGPVRLQETISELVVTVFASPEPLTTGPRT